MTGYAKGDHLSHFCHFDLIALFDVLSLMTLHLLIPLINACVAKVRIYKRKTLATTKINFEKKGI